MKMKILIPIDFSDVTFRQLEAVRPFALQEDIEIELLHVHHVDAHRFPFVKSKDGFSIEEQHRLMKLHLRNLNMLLGKETNIQTRFVNGKPVRVIVDRAKQFDLIIVGNQGHGAKHPQVFGSVARAIFKKVKIPVLVVPLNGERPKVRIADITMGVDFGPETSALGKMAIGYAKRFGAKLHLVSVLTTMDLLAETPALISSAKDIRHQLRQSNERLSKVRQEVSPASTEPDDIEITCEVDFGDPAEQLLEIAKRVESDWILIGTHGHGMAYDLIMGSTTEQILQEADCPVLLIPAIEKKAKHKREGSKVSSQLHLT